MQNRLKISMLRHNGRLQARIYFPKGSFTRPKGGYAWYRSRSQAQEAVRSEYTQRQKFGELAGTVTLTELVEARRASDELKGTGFSVVEAAKQVRAAAIKALASKPVGDGLRSYLAILWMRFQERKRANRRCEPRHWRSVKRTIARLHSVERLSLRELTPDQLRPLFKGLSRASIQGHARNLNAAFNFCIAEGWMEMNPAHGLHRMVAGKDSNPRVVRTFSVGDARKFMAAVAGTDVRAVPYFAVCFFAGVRPEAAMKLTWNDVGTNGYLYVPHSANKSGHAYNVQILPVLNQWLEWWEAQGNIRRGDILPLSASTLRRIRKEAMRRAGISHWIQDGPRKTFATAHRGTFKCKVGTAAALGHKGTSVLDEHYDSRLMTEGEAGQYWHILPPRYEQRVGKEAA